MVVFITGIDTDIGKTYITGLIARYFFQRGKRIITMKAVQTGNNGDISEDIIVHRKIMGTKLTQYDTDGITCPYLFKYPASPHLSARLENKTINPEIIINSIKKLERDFEIVLVEGAGGIYVPIRMDYTLFNLIKQINIPVVVVTSPRLGSINHTLLTYNTLNSNGIKVLFLVYNMYGHYDKIIAKDSLNLFKEFTRLPIIEVGEINIKNPPNISFPI